MILSLIFFSCDPPSYYDYYIINQCNEEITVCFKALRSYSKFNADTCIVLLPHEKELIYRAESFNRVEDRYIELFFKEITIQKRDKKSKVDYIDKNLWIFEAISRHYANSYLTVNPEDFEDD